MASSNLEMASPEGLRATQGAGGGNLVWGINNLVDDRERGEGRSRIKRTDVEAFELGENIALTPGKGVYQNDLMQLIQDAPATEEVHKRPLLIIPPWINKYYILEIGRAHV